MAAPAAPPAAPSAALPGPCAPPVARGVWQLALAQLLAVGVAAVAAALYARWLQPAQLAGWLMALGVARAGVLVLEGGLKTALVRRGTLPDAASLQRLVHQGAWLAAAASAGVAVLAWWLADSGRLGAEQAWLLAICPAAYFCCLPPLPVALARLERAGQFGVVGRAEGLSLLLEFALPAVLLACGAPPALAFGAAVLVARLLRTAWLIGAARRLPAVSTAAPGVARGVALWREGASVQAVAGLSMLRDQMHLWLLGPWFGTVWTGLYGLAGTACALASQAPVQTAARVALPALRASAPAAMWPALLRQTRLLAIACLPPLLLLPGWLAAADAHWWAGAWSQALPLLPWMLLRMAAGVALTTLGVGLLLAPGAWTAARVHARWTGLEVALAVAGLAWFGPQGLAMAGAVGAWLGVLLFLHGATPAGAPWRPRLVPLLAALLLRPSLACASLLALWVHVQPSAWWTATLALPCCWLAEPAVQRWWRQRRGSLAPVPQAGLP